MYYIGIDVSTKESAVCILDGKGKIVREAKLATDPRDYRTLYCRRYRVCPIERIGLESECANFGVSDRRFRFKPAGGFGGNRQAVSVQSGTPSRRGFGAGFGEPLLQSRSYLAWIWQSKYSNWDC